MYKHRESGSQFTCHLHAPLTSIRYIEYIFLRYHATCLQRFITLLISISDQAAMRLAAFAQQYDMIRLRKDCEETLTSSYANMRKNKKTGMMPTETILAYLKPADEFKYEKLLNMCIDDAVDNVFVDGKIERMEDDLSYPVQKEILRRKNIKLRQQLSKKTRELEMSETERNERRAEFHPIWRR